MTGSFEDGKGHIVFFDSARVGDSMYLEVHNADGVQLVKIETTADSYDSIYMNGALKMRASKEWVKKQRTIAQEDPEAVSSEGLVFDGDLSAPDKMLQLPEAAMLPHLSRALGARGYNGRDFSATLTLHQLGRQSATALKIEVEKLPAPPSIKSQDSSSYCSRPTANECYGMCGPGCSCWSWVCGDCCYHWGCAQHDSWCRHWWGWALCYSPAAIVGAAC